MPTDRSSQDLIDHDERSSRDEACDADPSPEALSAACATNDQHAILGAIRDIAQPYGMTALSQEAGITREALYKILGEKGNPTLRTFIRILKVLGWKITLSRI